MDVCDLGGGSGPPRLHTGGDNILWVKKNQDTREERLQIATYNVRTLLKDEHVLYHSGADSGQAGVDVLVNYSI